MEKNIELMPIDVTEEQMKSALQQASIEIDNIKEITVDDIYANIKGKSSFGNDLKNILRGLCHEVYEESEDICNEQLKIVNSSKKDKNEAFLKSSLFINGIGFEGITPDSNKNTQEQEEEPIAEEPVEEKISVEKDVTVTKATDISSAQKYYDRIYKSIRYVDNDENIYFDATSNNVITDKCSVLSKEHIGIVIDKNNYTDKTIDREFCIIADNHGKVVMFGRFVEMSDNMYMDIQSDNIDFETMKQDGDQYTVIWKDSVKELYYGGSIKIILQSVELSDSVLCIDFGTSNTTMGIYSIEENGIKIAEFVDTVSNQTSKLFPTLVYVNKIGEVDIESGEVKKVEYLFGYDARKMLIENNYSPNGDIFFEIKRWIIEPESFIEINDGQKHGKIKKIDIISAYLHHVLKRAEDHFKCRFKKMHFSAPVKLKSMFIDVISRYIFKKEEYEVLSAEESIDEAVSSVYDYISKQVVDYAKEDGDSRKNGDIMIVDCGGGTTDIARCRYSYIKKPTGYSLEIEPQFVNGNPNFGGNNITYRIFQLLKIKLADYYNQNSEHTTLSVKIAELISGNQGSILNKIDKCINNGKEIDIYDSLDIESKKSEEILPTDFNGDNIYAKSNKTKSQVKRNFYYLWQLAERIKIEFFAKTELVSFELDSERKNSLIEIDPRNLFFYIKNPKDTTPPLIKTNGVPKIEINTKEITALLRPDIYYLLATLVSFENYSRDLIDLRIKLSGQSCKISLFEELFKEFIPGRLMRMGSMSAYEGTDPEKLKLQCVEGSIAYIRDKYYHIVDSVHKNSSPSIIYDVVLFRGSTGMKGHALFKGRSFRKNADGQLVAEPLHIEQYDRSDILMDISVYNTMKVKEKDITDSIKAEQTLLAKTSYDYSDKNRICLEYKEGGKNSLEGLLENHAYYNIKQCMVCDSDGNVLERNLIEDLIVKIKDITLNPGEDRIIVFGVPNKDGYGFILCKLLKKCDSKGNETYYIKYTNVNFESSIMSKSFFNGRNCDDVKGDDKGC